MTILPRVTVALVAAAALATPAAAFDCTKAQTAVEQTICADPALKAKDDELSRLYAEVKQASSEAERKMLALAQRQWIADREAACPEKGDSACVGDKTDERLALFTVRPEAGKGTGRRMIPVFVAQQGDSTHYTVAFNLARFAEAASPGERAFNAAVAEIATKAPLGRNGQNTGERTLESDADLTVTYASPDLISAAVTSWADDGGAHGNGGVTSINIDLARGKELAVQDVLTEAGARKLGAACREQIIAAKRQQNGEDYQPEADSFLSDAVIAEHIATLSRWSFSASEATITFDSYAIGAYAEGPFECVFPLAEVKAAALPGARLPE